MQITKLHTREFPIERRFRKIGETAPPPSVLDHVLRHRNGRQTTGARPSKNRGPPRTSTSVYVLILRVYFDRFSKRKTRCPKIFACKLRKIFVCQLQKLECTTMKERAPFSFLNNNREKAYIQRYDCCWSQLAAYSSRNWHKKLYSHTLLYLRWFQY